MIIKNIKADGYKNLKAVDIQPDPKINVLYGDNFFNEVAKLKKGEAAVIESGNRVFLLQRQVITNDDDGFVFIYRSEMLEILKMKDLEKKLSEIADSFEVKINNRLCNEISEIIL